jgi:hypothetical protein
MGVMSESNRKSLQWLQIHHIQFKFKPQVLLHSTLYTYFYVYFMGHERKTFNNNGNWVLLHMTFYESIHLLVCCTMNEHKIATYMSHNIAIGPLSQKGVARKRLLP